MGFIRDLEHFLEETNDSLNTSSLRNLLRLHNTTLANGTDEFVSMLHSGSATGRTFLLLFYSVIFVVSLIANSLVCYIIMKNKRLHTVTNLFIANLAISDIIVTILNIPFNVARFLLEDWPFGTFLCQTINLSLMTSVYVSTYSLTGIALDRHQVIMYPLRPRMGIAAAIILIVLIWIFAILLSLPYGIYTRVQEVSFFIKTVKRCRSQFPEPKKLVEQCLTVVTFMAQYVMPLAIIMLTYGRIVQRLWSRATPGAVTRTQQLSHKKAKRRSIKLLILVVAVFALCWMPLNLYHILTDIHPNTTLFLYDSTAFFICHWIAVSCACYNPFIYCWLNEVFRREVKRRLNWCYRKSSTVHPGIEIDGLLVCAEQGQNSLSRLLVSTTRTTCSRREHVVVEACKQSASNSGVDSSEATSR